MAEDRDIDLVLVTGAGASRDFGVNATHLPLMGDWSDALVTKLGLNNGYRNATRLETGLDGAEFEDRLGAFLRRAAAFSEIRELLQPSTEFQQIDQHLAARGVLEGWHDQASFHLGAITDLIHESLYEKFADAAVDLDAATQAYGWLFAHLGLSPGQPWVYATTNYDVIADQAIQGCGYLADWGEAHQTLNYNESPLRVERIIDGMPRFVPVLHLHGRVGWYRSKDGRGRLFGVKTTKHHRDEGWPIVMLPDPKKIYDADSVINPLWAQFAESLQRAKRVLLLGHSLNDRFLLTTIQQTVQPLDRVAVTVLDNGQGEPDSSASPVLETIKNQLGNAAIIPMRFGAGPDAGRRGIRAWIEKTDGDGLA